MVKDLVIVDDVGDVLKVLLFCGHDEMMISVIADHVFLGRHEARKLRDWLTRWLEQQEERGAE